MRRRAAFSFSSSLPLADMRTRLNSLGAPEWIERDSEQHGDYLSALVREDVWLKIFVRDAGAFLILIDFRTGAEDAAFDAVCADVNSRLLPAMRATAIASVAPED